MQILTVRRAVTLARKIIYLNFCGFIILQILHEPKKNYELWRLQHGNNVVCSRQSFTPIISFYIIYCNTKEIKKEHYIMISMT